MLKTVLYYLLLLTTSIRFLDVLYLLAKQSTNLPLPVLVATTGIVLYGIVLIVKKYLSGVRLKDLAVFYVVQSAIVVFNIVMLANSPLSVNLLETIAAGSFLDLILNCGLLVAATKQIRSGYATLQRF